MKLSSVQQKFILHWGEMGTRWGINRTLAQVHALLYLSPDPLNAEEIVETLSVARSSVSNSIRELKGWGIVRNVHVLGDRRDHFETYRDVWELFRVILDQRKKREIDPTLELLKDCVRVSRKDEEAKDNFTRERLVKMLEFFENLTGFYQQVSRLPTGVLAEFVKSGNRLPRWIKASTSDA